MLELDVFDLIKTVSIQETIRDYVALKKDGRNYLGLCPFHNDHRIGNFVVMPAKGKFKCFACDAYGDGADFVREYCGVSALEAAVRIAENQKLITPIEAEEIRGRVVPPRCTAESKVRRAASKPKYLLSTKADQEHLDKMYQAFARAGGAVTPDFRDILLNERKLSETDLRDYFVFPLRADKKAFMVRFRKEIERTFSLSDENIQDKLLLGVPGFFVDDDAEVTFPAAKYPSIGISVYDRDHKCSGIQTRVMVQLPLPKPGEKKPDRYKFLSSGFADGQKDSYGSFGCGCGYVEDVLYPNGRHWCGAIALTEGRFKAVALSKMGFLVVNMHSISNWAPAGDVAIELSKKYPPSRFVLVYDQENNGAVTKSAMNLAEKLQFKPVEMAVWDSQFGKGVDDVVNAGRLSKISRVPCEEFFKKKQDT